MPRIGTCSAFKAFEGGRGRRNGGTESSRVAKEEANRRNGKDQRDPDGS
jgi:hypothetical protein